VFVDVEEYVDQFAHAVADQCTSSPFRCGGQADGRRVPAASKQIGGESRMREASLAAAVLLGALTAAVNADLSSGGVLRQPQPAAASRVIPLWPEGVPGAKAGGGEERVEDGRVYNVQAPAMLFYPAPASIANGTAVIVAPGGGYERLAIGHEGTEVARRLNALGVSAFVLKYRLVEFGHPAPLQDVLRAIRIVRSGAGEFGIRPDRIGLFGSSAGGHLAATAATLFAHADGRTGSAIDAIPARPDFVALLYPVITMNDPFAHAGSRRSLLGERPGPSRLDLLSPDKQVTRDTPPVFIVHTAEDASVPVENSLLFYQALRRYRVPVEMHLFEKGPHGFGMRAGLGTTSDWPRRLEEWLRSRGLLDR
jgi:acetyl esterase/lipase